MRSAALPLLACLVVACGSSGDDGEDEVPQAERPVQGQPGVRDEAVTLTGTLYLGDRSTPASGFEVWILDHTDGGTGRFPLGAGGAISIPLSIFRVGHLYTFHLVDDDRMLGDFDFGASTSGAQPGLVYDGGYGFDLGSVVANVTSRGEIDVDDPGLSAEVGGGFMLDVESTASFATLPPPDGIESFHFRSQLTVFDPVTLLYAFYHRDAFPERHAEALRDQSRVVVSVTTRSKRTVARLSLTEAGAWTAASRRAADTPDASRGDSSLWSAGEFDVPATDDEAFLASVFTSTLLTSNDIAVFKVEPAAGPTLLVPRLLGRVYAVPPKPTAIALDAGTPAPIDYTLPASTGTSTDAATGTATSVALRPREGAAAEATTQGLLAPFCYAEQGVTLVYDPPLDERAEAVVGASYGVVAVTLDYYGLGEDGRTTPLAATAADFPGDFAAAHADSSSSDPARAWNPETRTATFTWSDEAAAAMTSATLQLWPEVFLESAAGSDVTSFRLRVYFRSKDDPGEAASALWLRRGC